MSVVDALGKTCPQPVIMTSKELDALAAAGRSAEAVEVLVDNMVAVSYTHLQDRDRRTHRSQRSR